MDPHQQLDFSNKVVLVTGSGRGIGFATAELFAAHGAHVVINSKTQESLEKATLDLQGKGHAVYGVRTDVSRMGEVRRMVDDVIRKFKRIDILINNAGIIKRNVTIEELSSEDWESTIATNLGSIFYLCKAVIPNMKRNKSGAIINIASQTAVYGSACAIAYPSSKGGILSFTRSLAREVGTFNIRVNAVSPGLIRTEMTRWAEEKRNVGEYAKINSETPLRRMGTPLEVASVCLFLASDLASYVTGQTISVNGGRPSSVIL